MHRLRVRSLGRLACRALVGVSAVWAAGAAQAQDLHVVTVPWLGNPNNAHQVFDGGELILQGTALLDAGCSIVSATWDPGDGTGPVAVPTGDPRALELAHTYNGSDGQPYTAVLSVTDTCGNTVTDNFRVVVRNKSLEVEVNMAIDHGLWRLHKNLLLGSSGGVDTGFYNSDDRRAATSTGALAFQANNHFETGDRLEDPYVDDVARLIAHLFTELEDVSIAAQAHGDPDSNGNGIGLSVSLSLEETYINGQVADAIAATRTPQATAPTGDMTWVMGRTYSEIVQDIMDGYHAGQIDAGSGRGSWDYNYSLSPNGGGGGDNSAAQWWAIGGIGADRIFGDLDQNYVEIPQWVKDENLNNFLPASQTIGGVDDGRYGYRSISPLGGENNGMNTTPSGMVQLIAGDVPNNDPRFDAAEGFMVSNWSLLISTNRIYGMFATAKAMRLALPDQVDLMGGTFDWYGSDTLAGDAVDGLARHLVSTQNADDTWTGGRWVHSELATGMAVIILSPTIIDPFPVAVCDVDPDTTGVGVTVTFDGTGSFHLDETKSIVAWDWDFDGDGTFDASGPVVQHSYGAVGTYPAKLRVTDDSQPTAKTNTTTCEVDIVPPPIPPDSNPGGPYTSCQDLGLPVILDGSDSFDPDGQIVAWDWDLPPLDGQFNDASGEVVDATAHFGALSPGIYDVGLRVTDNDTLTDVDFATVEIFGPGDCPLTPPQFTGPSACGTELMVTAAAPFSHEVCATDADQGDIVTLEVSGLPPGAVMNPALPLMGNPVCSTIEWSPPISEVGNSYDVTFTATDSDGLVTTCQLTLTVTECYLLVGGGPGAAQIMLGGHLFQTGLSDITRVYPVTLDQIPDLRLHLPPRGLGGSGGTGPLMGKAHFGAVQILMWAPEFFPSNPEQATKVLDVYVKPNGSLIYQTHGQKDGMDIQASSFQNPDNFLYYARFPFAIDGL